MFTLVSLLFSQPNLSWAPLDHVETFAGDLSVTLGEWQVWDPLKAECLLVEMFWVFKNSKP